MNDKDFICKFAVEEIVLGEDRHFCGLSEKTECYGSKEARARCPYWNK